MTQGDPGRVTTLGSPRSPSRVHVEGVDVGGEQAEGLSPLPRGAAEGTTGRCRQFWARCGSRALTRWAEAAAPGARQRSRPLQAPAQEKEAGSWEVRLKAGGRLHTPGCRDPQERGTRSEHPDRQRETVPAGVRCTHEYVSGGPGLPNRTHALQAPPEGTVPITLALGTQGRSGGSLEGTERPLSGKGGAA